MNFFKLYDILRVPAEAEPDGSGEEESGVEGEEVVEEGAEESGETEEEAEAEEEDISESEVKEAKALYKLLKDKNTQRDTLRVLAERAGLLTGNETKADVKEAKKDLKAIIKDKLGDDFKFFGDKLSDVLEAVLEEERKTNTASLSQLQLKETERETSSALERLSRETKGNSPKFEGAIIKLMDKYTPAPGITIYDYLKDLYTIASSGKVAASTKAQIADKIRRNSSDAVTRLQSTGTRGKEGTPPAPAKKGLKAAVEFALSQQEKGK